MPYASASFIYFFLPLVLLCYHIVPRGQKNLVLLVASLFFCFWAEPVFWVALPVTALSGYCHGLWLAGTKKKKLPLISGTLISVGLLVLVKYSSLIGTNVNSLFRSESALMKFILPVGLSIATLQVLSYIFDLYRGRVQVQGNILDFFTYVCMFPQLPAGPVLAYGTIAAELKQRTHSFADSAVGIRLFCLGLAKKVLLGGTLAEMGYIFADVNQPTVLFHWLAAVAFLLQIYYDLSGYSDMARGLGALFGFPFPVNFNYPLAARSITQFWQRWFISLGAWFREYVFEPLLGKSPTSSKTSTCLLMTGAILGLWHGPGWNRMLWGLSFAVLIILERVFIGKLLARLPRIVGHGYVLTVLLLVFVLFKASTLQGAVGNLAAMLGLSGLPWSSPETIYTLHRFGLVLLAAVLGATPLPAKIISIIRREPRGDRFLNLLEPALLLAQLLLVTGYLPEGVFNPYAYFRL